MKTRKTIDFIIQNLVLVLVLVWCVCVSVPQSGVTVMQSSTGNTGPYERLVAPGPPNHREAYFNGSSYLRLQTAVSLKRHIGLSFKTCSGGELFSQNYKDREIKLSVQNSQLLLTIASSLFRVEIPIDGHFLDNEWHTVNIVYRLANLTLSVDDYVQVVANSTYNNYILTDPDLHSDNAVLIVGKLFTGCLIDGPSLVFDNSLQNPYLPKFGGCLLLPNCSIDYGLISDLTLAEKPSNHCVNEPCLRMGKCISHKADYECICKPQYAGKNCDRDVGPPCTRKIDPVICKNGGICHELDGDFTCMCPGGFEGKYCEQDMSRFCDLNMCQNNGTCLKLSSNEYKCICMDGFSGANCELDFNDCASNPCKNNAKCIDGPNTYMCQCPIGFEGKNCEYNIDECAKKPCKYNGVCFDTYGSYICQCLSGFYGQNCELNVNECLSNPCLNGGQCNDEVGSYLCHCAEGFTGQRCESRTTCNGIACPLNADCQEIKSGEFQCICKTGYAGTYSMEGLKNCILVPGCEANTCRNGGTCYEFGDKFNCTCAVGFTGIRCETSERCKAASLCLNGGTCIDELNNSYKCQCSKEYTGTNCEKRITCKDNPCVYADACNDYPGSYYCKCKTGYTGFNCDVDIDECDHNLCKNGATCIQNSGFFNCVCAPGFTGKLCHTKIDSCASHPCKNGATCSEQLNGFTCNCPPDYTGMLCEKTQNICDRQRPCQNNATCIIMDKNEFKCNCTPGFDGPTCSNNIDDCQGKVCPEGQICIDGINSYECQCPPGFAGDNCSLNVDFCKSQPCKNNATCIDNGHLYRCQCLPGYTGTQCETDIDECSLPQYSKFCLHGICVNSPGSFSCYCQPGYTGEQCEVNYDECLSNPCKNMGDCIDEINNYTCICSPGYTGRDCTVNINDCDPNPCVEGSTCIDGINSYTCECQPGLTGQNCEINIDDCEPNPCLNGGLCIDGLNSYDCNCTSTGYTGMRCEINIDDCLSNPCEHGALCMDGVNDYQCACFEGYTGKNCEFDFDDCESSPCKYNGTCLQRSNETLYYSQSDWNSTLPSIFHEEFNYNTSSGYECICVPGTMGHDCEINIDECQSSPCVGGSTCQDKIGEFVCLCENGFEGDRCEHEIDECERYKPCVFGKCTDRIANYDCECNPGYGGKNCSVQLTGCDKNECLNNGTCKPYLVNETIHKFNCSCPNGFHGRVCEKVTTMSFNGASYVVLNTSREEGYDIQFRFKTTLASGLLAVGKGSTYYFLELTNGRLNLHSSILNKWEGVFIGSKLNDSNWQKVFVAINSSHLVLAANEEQTIYPITINEGSTNHTSFPTTYIGGTISNLRGLTPLTQNLPDFVGCTEDVVVNGEWVIPEDILSTPSSETAALVNISLGCPREEQCTPNPCHSGGHCTDLWQTFKCVCERPYLGRTCQYNFTAATFGHENITNSVATVNITESARRAIRSIAHISMFIRTRQDKGQIFHLGSAVPSTRSADDIYIAAQLEAGELLVGIQFNGTPEAYAVNGVKLHNGYNHLIEVSRNVTLIQVKLNGTEYFRKTISATGPLDVQFLYLGGIPQPSRPVRQADSITASQQNRAELNTSIPNFKGIIQDVQISNGTKTMVVEFFPLKADDLEIPLSFGKVAFEKNLILQGVVSDDMCRSNPCFNNGTCFNTWNDFECKCPLGYKGKACQEMEFCQLQHCPYGSTCRSLNNGYECIANITFDSSEPLKYEFVNITEETILDFNTVTINYRSNAGGTMFYAQSDGEYFIVSVYRDTVFVNWKIRDETDVHLFRKDTPDGNWTSLLFIIKDNELKGGFEDNVIDELPNFTSMKSFSAEAFSNLLKRSKIVLGEGFNVLDKNKLIDRNYKYINSTVYDTISYATTEAIMMENSVDLPVQSTIEPLIDPKMSENYKGCLGEIRIGEYLLPYYMKTEIYKNMTPTEYFDLITDRSQSKYYKDSCILCFDTDCKNGGQCKNNKQEYVCDCPAGFEADDCRINIDECVDNNCTNNSTCIDGIANYTCTCQPGWEGWLCDSQIDECLSNPCFNGGECKDKLAAFECICLDAYTGDRCEALKLITCDNNPCRNGATCIDGKNVTTGNNFTCNCASGYEGSVCDKPFCEVNSCDRGYCNITDGLPPFCACHPGYTGKYCEENIDDCVVSTGGSPCQHGGICIDGIEKFTCNCTGTGYGGLLCEMDNNECVMYPKEETCGWNGTCINIEGSYRCECALGKCGFGCKLDDPCYQTYRDVNASSVIDVCGPYGNCQEMCDITAKYNCICSDGYIGKNCESLMATREEGGGGINLAYIIVPIVLILVGALVAGVCVLVAMARNKRATRGTYSPSAQEFCNPRVEMDHVLKPPPEERLI